MDIQKEIKDATLVANLIGNIDSTTAGDLEVLKDELTDIQSLVLDFTEVGYISSKGIRVILMLNKLMQGKGGMKITNANNAVREVFRLSGLLPLITLE